MRPCLRSGCHLHRLPECSMGPEPECRKGAMDIQTGMEATLRGQGTVMAMISRTSVENVAQEDMVAS